MTIDRDEYNSTTTDRETQPAQTPVQHLLAALIASVPSNKQHLISHECYEETTCFEAGCLAEGVTVYVIDDGSPTRLWLNGIESRVRRQGLAKAVFEKLCALADDHGVTLAGNVLAYDPDDVNRRPDASFPSDAELVAWYKRLGFRITRKPENLGEAIVIERIPRSGKPQHTRSR